MSHIFSVGQVQRLVNSNNETVQTFDNPTDFDSKDYLLLWREDKYGNLFKPYPSIWDYDRGQ